MLNKISLNNLNPGKRITWAGNNYKSFADMSRKTGYPKSTIQDYFHRDEEYKGSHIDEQI